MKELSDSLANNVLLVGPERHELSPEERLKNSLIAAHVDDCLNLLKSNNPATPYWKLIKEATVKAKEKYVALGGERDQWSERMALTGAKSKRYSTSD